MPIRPAPPYRKKKKREEAFENEKALFIAPLPPQRANTANMFSLFIHFKWDV
jgi:hypothetical protein